MTNISVFEFKANEIRFVDDKPVGNDVAEVLGYADPAKTISTRKSDRTTRNHELPKYQRTKGIN